MASFVARQPILNRNREVDGYELLFRSSAANAFDGTDGSRATSQVIANGLFAVGLETILSDKRAFINFPRELLIADFATVLSPESTVIEILETVEPDPALIEACWKLKAQGYVLALDDFVCHERFEPLTQIADIIKVDFRSTPAAQQEILAKQYARRGIKMLAEKVETPEEFEHACRAGYVYFQGYFFAKPGVLTGREVPGYKLHYLQVLELIHQPSLDFGKLENLIKQDVSLAYKLLRYINAARFGYRQKIESIKHALVLLGEAEIRRWASLALLSGMCDDKPRELLLSAIIRGRFCELVGQTAGLGQRKSDLFLIGMFSLLDAIMDLPLEEVLSSISVQDDVRRVLLHTTPAVKRLGEVYDAVRAYEVADWQRLSAVAGELRMEEDCLPDLYLQAVQWSDEIFKEK